MGDVVADAFERVDHRLHFVEHAVDDDREPGKRLVDVTVWQPLAQIAGDDALDPLVDLLDALLGPHAQPRACQQAKQEGRQQAERQRLTDDMGDLARLVDLASDHQRIAIGHAPGDRPDHAPLLPGRRRPDDRDAPDDIVHLQFRRNPFEIACDPAAVGAEQRGILHAAGILLQVLVDGVDPAIGRQRGDEVELSRDHRVGSRHQIVVGLPVDEAEQHDDEDREHGSHRERPVKGVRAYELRLTHRILPPGCHARRQRRRHAAGHLNAMIPCEG